MKEALLEDEIESGDDFGMVTAVRGLACEIGSRHGLEDAVAFELLVELAGEFLCGSVQCKYIVPFVTASGTSDPLVVTFDLDNFRRDLADAADKHLGGASGHGGSGSRCG